MGNVFYFDWEVNLIEWLQKTIGSAGQAIAKAVTFIGGETVMLLVLLVVLFCYKKEAGKRCGFTMVPQPQMPMMPIFSGSTLSCTER